MTDATTITVSGDASYDITVGRGILSRRRRRCCRPRPARCS